jgi:hypothetical protein
MINAIPAERLVNPNLKLTESECRARFAEAICDEVPIVMDTRRLDELAATLKKKDAIG